MDSFQVEDGWVLRLARGELVVAELEKFCMKEGIEGGFFYGLGAVDEAELAHYNVEDREYTKEVFGEPFEVTNLTGSVGMFEDEVVVHAHITLSDMYMKALGGHLVEARVSGTLEVWLKVLPRMTKVMDEATGLKVFLGG